MSITTYSLGCVFLFICLGLSGCEESLNVTGDFNKVKIIDYSVSTQWYIPGYGTYQSFTKSGFYKNVPAEAYNPRYIVIGKAKNIAGEDLNSIIITVIFCDSNYNHLISENTTLNGFADNTINNFEINLYLNNLHFNKIEKVKFKIDVI
jgi:hypothetical protein